MTAQGSQVLPARHQCTHSTMEIEENTVLQFLDILITVNNSFHHTVYRKSTITIHSKTLTYMSTFLTNPQNNKLSILKEALQKNDYTSGQIHAALSNKKQMATKAEKEESTEKVIFLYIKGTTKKKSARFFKNTSCKLYSTQKNQCFRTPHLVSMKSPVLTALGHMLASPTECMKELNQVGKKRDSTSVFSQLDIISAFSTYKKKTFI